MLTGCTVDHTNTEVINGLEGKNLLSALKAFVAVVVNAPLEASNKQGKVFLQSFRHI